MQAATFPGGFTSVQFATLCLMALLTVTSGVSAQNQPIPNVVVNQTFCTSSTAPCVLTYHNDNNRDGVNPIETRFTSTFFQTHSLAATAVAVDGLIYAQPLYIHQLSGITAGVGTGCGSATNVVFVATENNSVYAINAQTVGVCWQHGFTTPGPPSRAEHPTISRPAIQPVHRQRAPRLPARDN